MFFLKKNKNLNKNEVSKKQIYNDMLNINNK